MHVVGRVEDALVHQPVADGLHEAPEHAHAELVDVEGVVLGQREAVHRRLVELVELLQQVRVVGQLGPSLGHQLLAGLHPVLVEQLGVLAVVELHQRADAGERDGRILPPRDVGQVVDRVAAPAELEEEVVELAAEGPALVGGVEGLEHLGGRLGEEQVPQGGAGLGDPAEVPQAPLHVDRAGVEALERLVRLGGLLRLHQLVVEVAERAARQQHEVDVAVDPPLVAHVVGELVELGHQLGVGQPGVVDGLGRLVLGLDLGLPLLLPRLAHRGDLLGQLVVVAGQPVLDLGLVGDRVEGHVEVVVHLVVAHHDRAVVLRLRLGEPLGQGAHDDVERQRRDGPRRVHLVERPEALDLVGLREHDRVAGRAIRRASGRRHLEPPWCELTRPRLASSPTTDSSKATGVSGCLRYAVLARRLGGSGG